MLSSTSVVLLTSIIEDDGSFSASPCTGVMLYELPDFDKLTLPSFEGSLPPPHAVRAKNVGIELSALNLKFLRF